jgi:predicted enzyme related to lactoylglutathione lyase
MSALTPGRFVWHELHTGDRAQAIGFYKTFLAWQIKEIAMGECEPYGHCSVGGHEVAGITNSMAPANVPPHWLPYIAVPDVDAYAANAKALGGNVMMPPMEIPDTGRFAVLVDPQGAAFAIFKDASGKNLAEPTEPPLGTFCWEELMSSDPAAAATFYAALFGYTIEEWDMGPMGTYRILKRGDRQTGGILKLPPNVAKSSWLAYLHVARVDEATRNAVELGAQVRMQPTDIPKIGRFSVIADPTGAIVALFSGPAKS